MYYEDSKDAAPLDGGRPPEVPEKFWDPTRGALRTDALLRAYLDLEKRLSGSVRVPGPDCTDEELCGFRRALGVPDRPDMYSIEERHPLLTSDAEVNQRLHAAGFTPQQAQLVYDLAHERVIPMMDQQRQDMESQRHLDKLKEYFGGEARFAEAARQVSAWGKANLPPEVYDSLARSSEGVMAMEKMMGSGEPAMGRAPAPRDEPQSEGDLKKMMQDPRYWKKRDPAFIEKVSAGFRRLHGEG